MDNEVEKDRKRKLCLVDLCVRPATSCFEKATCSLPLGEKQQMASKLTHGMQRKIAYMFFV